MRTKQSRFTFMLLGIVATGVLLLATGLFLWQTQEAKTNHINKAYAEKTIQLTDIKTKLATMNAEKQKLDELNASLAILQTNLADYKYVPTYLQQMQTTAAETGNRILTIQPAELRALDFSRGPFAMIGLKQPNSAVNAATTTPADANTTALGPTYQAQNINLDIDGTYVSIIRLLDAFRHFPKMIYVRSIDFSPKNTNGVETVTARMKTYAIITPDQYLADKDSQGQQTAVQR